MRAEEILFPGNRKNTDLHQILKEIRRQQNNIFEKSGIIESRHCAENNNIVELKTSQKW